MFDGGVDSVQGGDGQDPVENTISDNTRELPSAVIPRMLQNIINISFHQLKGTERTFPVIIHIIMIPNAQQSTSRPVSQPKSISGASHHSRALGAVPRCLSSIVGGTFGRVAITMACSNPLMQTCPFTRKRIVVGRRSLCITPAPCMKEMPDA